ncbi:protein TIFY 10c-like [Phragmites australis]|uniref:protein TIFY 10c-like n=1 Tax=Phragmites australis TaxID=29695 RepID=UPI002D7944DE|nr:protein TIFY 10c-like [Phragmites australis]
MAGRAAAAAAAAREKSSFAVTCSLLSQYLKDKKGGLDGLGFGMAPPAAAGVFRPPTTMNLLSALDAPAEEPNEEAKTTVEPPPSVEEASTEPPVLVAPTDQQNGENPRKAAGEEAQQLTIFYGGKMVVFDNFPSTKVKDLLQMLNTGDGVDKAGGSAAPQNLPRPSQSSLSDLPVARRNSLHRFLEKRKGRMIAKAPYQVNSSVEASKQATGEKSWLGLGQEVKIKQEI